ncbi:MAG: uracil phosphoribosyltransferase [Bacilli bacterium]
MNQSTFIVRHPLIDHKMTIIRDKKTHNNEFRAIVKEITQMIVYPATHHLSLEKKSVTTPMAEMVGHQLANEVLVIPIMRAGLGMLDGFTTMVPIAKVGHVGFARDEKTLKATPYIIKIPKISPKTEVFILDPMLATGGTLVQAIDLIKKKGAKIITYLGLVAVQPGIDYVLKHHPDVKIYLASLDKQLNQKGFIVPGLGDAGDRLFGQEG